jgi:hypothetical protein
VAKGGIGMATEKQVELAHNFYQAKKTMKFLHGDKYPEKVADIKTVIDKIKTALKCDTLQAVTKYLEALTEKYPYDSGIMAAMMFATVVEMTEGILVGNPDAPSGAPTAHISGG